MRIPIKLSKARFNKMKLRFERGATNPKMKTREQQIFDNGLVYPYPFVWNQKKRMWIGRAIYRTDDAQSDTTHIIRVRDWKFAKWYKTKGVEIIRRYTEKRR